MRKKNGLKEGMKMDWDIYRTGVLVDLTISKWGRFARLTPGDLGLAQEDVVDLINLGVKYLTHRHHVGEIYRLGREAHNFLMRNSFPFPLGGTRFVPFTVLPKVVERIETLSKNYNKAVDRFVDEEYSKIREEMLKEYDLKFEQILTKRNQPVDKIQDEKAVLLRALRDKYPSPEDLRKRYGIDLSIFQINLPELKGIGEEEAIDKARLNAEIEKEYRRKAGERIDKFLEGVIAQLKTMVLEMVDKLSEQIKKGSIGLLTVSSFRRFAKTFKDMDFVDIDVNEALQSLESNLSSVEKKQLQDKEFHEKLEKELDSIRVIVNTADVPKVMERFKRLIRVASEGEQQQRKVA
jgi:hypothetical protein